MGFIAGWAGGAFPVYLDGHDSPDTRVTGSGRLADRAARWDFADSRQVEVGIPDLASLDVTILWSWVETRDQARRAVRFRPLPSLVLKMGGSARRLCIWALNEQAPYVLAESGNKKLSYALHAPQKYARPEKLRIPLPGTFLRVGRSRPSPVLVTRLEASSFARSQVVATLRDPPKPWHVRQREKGLWR